MDLKEQKKLMYGKEAFNSLCIALDSINFNYDKDVEKLMVRFGVNGDDIPVSIVMSMDVERQLVRLYSFFPFKVKSDKIAEVTMGTCIVNYRLADGSFDINVEDGTLLFRMTTSFRESLLGPKALEYMFSVAVTTIDEYNDKFEALNNGTMSLAEFMDRYLNK